MRYDSAEEIAKAVFGSCRIGPNNLRVTVLQPNVGEQEIRALPLLLGLQEKGCSTEWRP